MTFVIILYESSHNPNHFQKLILHDIPLFQTNVLLSMQYKQIVFIFSFLVISFLIYSTFIYSNLPFKSIEVSEQVVKGKEVWQRYNCNSCHQIYGLGGFLGPDLTNIYSKRPVEYIKAFLLGGTVVMPKFNLSDTEINCLISFFKNIDSTGSADPNKIILNLDGTITNK